VAEDIFKLPGRHAMWRRLLTVNKNPHMQQHLYPSLLKDAGTEKVPQGVVLMLQIAFEEYTQGLPSIVGRILNEDMDKFIGALVPDAKMAAQAKEFWEQARKHVCKARS